MDRSTQMKPWLFDILHQIPCSQWPSDIFEPQTLKKLEQRKTFKSATTPTFEHHCVLITVRMDKHIRQNTFTVDREQVFICYFVSDSAEFQISIKFQKARISIFTSLGRFLIIFLGLYMALLIEQLKIRQESGWERGGVTHSKEPQARTRTWGCCSVDTQGTLALPTELNGAPFLGRFLPSVWSSAVKHMIGHLRIIVLLLYCITAHRWINWSLYWWSIKW